MEGVGIYAETPSVLLRRGGGGGGDLWRTARAWDSPVSLALLVGSPTLDKRKLTLLWQPQPASLFKFLYPLSNWQTVTHRACCWSLIMSLGLL